MAVVCQKLEPMTPSNQHMVTLPAGDRDVTTAS